jgi:hypothetical protein
MNDKELLYLAAKAAGIEVVTPTMLEYGKWNPLTDDGDALRLAVKLMEFEPYKSRGYLPCITADAQITRRAIVRAAAEIGKAMP